MYLIELNDKNFQSEVLESKEICVVGFGTDWCKPCVSVLVLKNGTEMGRFIGYISFDKLEELISSCPGVDDIKSNGKKSSIDT